MYHVCEFNPRWIKHSIFNADITNVQMPSPRQDQICLLSKILIFRRYQYKYLHAHINHTTIDCDLLVQWQCQSDLHFLSQVTQIWNTSTHDSRSGRAKRKPALVDGFDSSANLAWPTSGGCPRQNSCLLINSTRRWIPSHLTASNSGTETKRKPCQS